MNEWDAVLKPIRPWSRTFDLTVGPEALDEARGRVEGDDLGAVLACVDLTAEASGAPSRLVELHAPVRRLPPGRFVASLAFQRYAHRVAGVGVAAFATAGVVPPLTATRTHLVVARGNPSRLVVPAPGVPTHGTLADLVETIVEGHLLPVAQALHAVTGVGMPNLWGNIGASVAAACKVLARRGGQGDEQALREARALGEAILQSRPDFRHAGEFVEVTDESGTPHLFFERHSCCHWHESSGKNCSWCTHLAPEERLRRFRAQIA